jgi:hypothetical protein
VSPVGSAVIAITVTTAPPSALAASGRSTKSLSLWPPLPLLTYKTSGPGACASPTFLYPYFYNRISVLNFIPLVQVHVVHVQRVKAYDVNTASSKRLQTASAPVAD